MLKKKEVKHCFSKTYFWI